MDVSKLTPGKRVAYKSRANEGHANVVSTERKRTGDWVTLHDKARNAQVVVRPSQVSSR